MFMIRSCPVVSCLAALLLAAGFILAGGDEVGAMGEKHEGLKPVEVDVLSVEGCQVTPPTIARIKEIADDMSIPVKINRIIVREKKEAVEKRFFGSPTVRMDGLDIEEHMRSSTSYGFG